MPTIFDIARAEDYEEALDLANYSFSHSNEPTDFLALLPKLFRREYFMEGKHYLAREDGKIKAMAGSYPLQMQFGDGAISLPGRGIGTVCAHPYARAKGYMTALLKRAMADMAREGAAFSCLGGLRQRYERFGFAPARASFVFSVLGHNLSHALGGCYRKTGLWLEKVGPESAAFLDGINALHEEKPARMRRERSRLFDILSSWKAQVYALTEGGRFEGYVVRNERGDEITEINLKDLTLLPRAIGAFMKAQGAQSVKVRACAHESEKIARLSDFSQEYGLECEGKLAILDPARFADALLRLKSAQTPPREGSFVIEVEDAAPGLASKTRLFCEDGIAGAETAGAGERPD
ncbi:MAG: GNAT family N-acetyltransferase, partial [Treponema sp.]|nr:GNAT family N-acetyltransferase [Treponema sp.]